MGLRTGRTAILLGVGNLGRALLNNFNFSASGFELLCAFDANPQLIGQRFGGHEVRSADTLAEFIECNKPDVAVLTIPRGDAPRIARGLVESAVSAACGISPARTFIWRDWAFRSKTCTCRTA